MAKQSEVTVESLVEALNNTGKYRFGFFNSNREYRDRKTGEMVKSLFANVSIQDTENPSERWFINRRDGKYVAKKAEKIAPKAATSKATSSNSSAANTDLAATLAAIQAQMAALTAELG